MHPPPPNPALFSYDLGQATRVTIHFILQAMLQVVRGLAHLHRLGIHHRDLRAANVLVLSLEPLKVRARGCLTSKEKVRGQGVA
jgi:hypothetical protein